MTDTTRLTPLRRFFKLLQVDKQQILSIYVYALFNGILTLSLPLGIQAIINLLTGGQLSTSWIILVCFVIAGIALTGVMQIMQLTISENLQQKIFTRSAFEFAYRIPRLKLEAVDQFHIPELVNRFFDTLSVQKGLSKILMDFSSASLQVIFGLLLLSLYHPFFILFSFALVLILYLIFRFTAPQGLRTSLEESKRKYEVAHWLEEVARSLETFKLAGNSSLALTKTDDVVRDYLLSRKAHFKTLLIQYINLVGFKVIVAAGLLLIGGLLVLNQQMNIGQFVASEIIIILVLSSIEKLILSMEIIYDVLTALEKLGNVTDIPLEREDGSSTEIDHASGLSVNLKNVSYRFPDSGKNILNEIDLSVNSGEKICISGFNGSGKSSLLQIIGGLYQDFTGTSSYQDVPIGNWSIQELRSRIGYGVAKDEIFKGTLEENITLGNPTISLEQLTEAAKVVGLLEFIESLPKAYNTTLVPEGKNLPKSVRLRIMLCRAIVGQPELILLEDSFNQLKTTDKSSLLDYLINQKATVIAISNDPRVAEKFHKTAVLKEGSVIAFDTHDNIQHQIWYSQIFRKQ